MKKRIFSHHLGSLDNNQVKIFHFRIIEPSIGWNDRKESQKIIVTLIIGLKYT
jgi:hypothetical protein